MEQIYSMCCSENITAFTQGAIDSLKHSLEQFEILISKQQERNINVDITDPNGSVDGEILRQYLEDGLQPVEALMLLIKEKAADESDFIEEKQEKNEETEENEEKNEETEENDYEELEDNPIEEENEEAES